MNQFLEDFKNFIPEQTSGIRVKDSFCLNFKTPPLPGVKGEYKEQGRVVQLDDLPVYIVGDTTTPPPTKVMLCLT